MKKLHLILLFFILIISGKLNAQDDITKFLGIPITGTKSEMISKIKSKGFANSKFNSEVLEGEFNGSNVNVHVVTNNNKVYRIMVAEQQMYNETDIRIRFNNLYDQFLNNEKYIAANVNENVIIPQNENISYGMLVNNKRYDAVFYQKSDFETSHINRNKIVWFMIAEHLNKYYITMFYDNEYNSPKGEDL